VSVVVSSEQRVVGARLSLIKGLGALLGAHKDQNRRPHPSPKELLQSESTALFIADKLKLLLHRVRRAVALSDCEGARRNG